MEEENHLRSRVPSLKNSAFQVVGKSAVDP